MPREPIRSSSSRLGARANDRQAPPGTLARLAPRLNADEVWVIERLARARPRLRVARDTSGVAVRLDRPG